MNSFFMGSLNLPLKSAFCHFCKDTGEGGSEIGGWRGARLPSSLLFYDSHTQPPSNKLRRGVRERVPSPPSLTASFPHLKVTLALDPMRERSHCISPQKIEMERKWLTLEEWLPLSLHKGLPILKMPWNVEGSSSVPMSSRSIGTFPSPIKPFQTANIKLK